MDNQQSTYYVPDQSKLPLLASFAMAVTAFGIAAWINAFTGGSVIFLIGVAFLTAVIWGWFAQVIKENMAGLNNAQLKRSYVMGMGWFIFSEVMFFAAFFGALYYIRAIALPDLSSGPTSELLWNGFSGTEWPLMVTPDTYAHGERATHIGPGDNLSNPGVLNWLGWLPFWNTVVLITSSFTVHFAHTALKNDNRKKFDLWLGISVALGLLFIVLQIQEYVHAYQDLGLTLASGVYGATFFMLTGFHGVHVTMGTIMLLVMFLRSRLKGHFKHDDCFGFEAASWYWHFVDVVWVGLFLFVYILG